MAFLIYFFVFLFGLLIGSFLNCLIYRLETDGKLSRRFFLGRSFCPHCKHLLGWQDLIPIFSFLILKRKCRYCQKPISWQYPLVELVTGILFVFIFCLTFQQSNILTFQQFIHFLYLLLTACFLIVIFVYDLKHYIIPDKIIYPAILVSGIWYLVFGIFFHSYTRYEIQNTIYSAFGAALFFLLIVLLSRGRWMGVGDVKLAFFMGLVLSFPNILVALFSAFFIGAAIGTGLIAAGKKRLSSEIPFGPFLVTGTFLAMFFGERLIDWYLNLFLL